MSELDKMLAVKDRSQAAGEFLEWLQSTGRVVCRWVDEVDVGFFPTHEGIEVLLAEWLDIDLDKVKAEKRALLAEIRGKG